MALLPGAPAADPGRALPARLFWIPILVLDLLLLATLPWAHTLAVAVISLAAFGWITRRTPVALAMAVAGMPLFAPVAAAVGDDRVTLATQVLFVLVPAALLAWNRLWNVRRGPAVAAVLHDPITWLVLALGAWIAFGLAWTPMPLYGGLKVRLFLCVNLVLFAGTAVYLRRDRDAARPESPDTLAPAVPRFLATLAWLQVLIALTAVWNWFSQYYVFENNRLRTLDMNTIWTARHMGLGILVLLGLNALGRVRALVLVPALALLAWVFLRSGSRGPLAALAVALGYWVLTTPRTRRSPGLTRALWAGAGVGVFAAIVMIQRTAGLFAAGRRVSNIVRARLLEVSFDALSDVSLRGLGSGGFPALLRLPDDRFYPHNIFLEVLLENGLVGLALLVGILVLTWRRWRGWGRRIRKAGDAGSAPEAAALQRTVGAILLFAVMNAQFSGDIWVNEWIWVGAAMVVACAPRDES